MSGPPRRPIQINILSGVWIWWPRSDRKFNSRASTVICPGDPNLRGSGPSSGVPPRGNGAPACQCVHGCQSEQRYGGQICIS